MSALAAAEVAAAESAENSKDKAKGSAEEEPVDAEAAAKLEETRKFYSLFNTLEEKKGYLSKEVSLLNSIHENYTKAAAGNKDRIVESVEGLLKSVQQNLQKVEQRLKDAVSARDATQQKYDKLVEKQRKYFQLVKEYQAECQRNGMLAS